MAFGRGGALDDPGIPAATAQARQWRWWVMRSLAGFAFGCGFCGLVQGCWVGLLATAYGGLDVALESIRPTATTQLAFAAFLATAPASFIGGLVAPLALGGATQTHRAIALSAGAGVGAAVATVVAAVLGALAGALCWQIAPRSMAFVLLALVLGLPAGIGGGCLGGRVFRRAEVGAAD